MVLLVISELRMQKAGYPCSFLQAILDPPLSFLSIINYGPEVTFIFLNSDCGNTLSAIGTYVTQFGLNWL